MKRAILAILSSLAILGIIYSAAQSVTGTLVGLKGFVHSQDYRGFNGMIDQMEDLHRQLNEGIPNGDGTYRPVDFEYFKKKYDYILVYQIKLANGVAAILNRLNDKQILELS